ncbi:hypothetical protein CSUI_000792, partial [Cystoisospora suis]
VNDFRLSGVLRPSGAAVAELNQPALPTPEPAACTVQASWTHSFPLSGEKSPRQKPIHEAFKLRGRVRVVRQTLLCSFYV